MAEILIKDRSPPVPRPKSLHTLVRNDIASKTTSHDTAFEVRPTHIERIEAEESLLPRFPHPFLSLAVIQMFHGLKPGAFSIQTEVPASLVDGADCVE